MSIKVGSIVKLLVARYRNQIGVVEQVAKAFDGTPKYKVQLSNTKYGWFFENEVQLMSLSPTQNEFVSSSFSPYSPQCHSGHIYEGAPQVCTHTFKTYIGFTSAFDYCVHCDTKREHKK